VAGKVVTKGIKWSTNRLKQVPKGHAGVFIIFDEDSKTAKVMENENIVMALRNLWWQKNFWHFSWFLTSPAEYRFKLAEKFMGMSYDDLWELSPDD